MTLGIETLHSTKETFDLVHSPDDGGWYLQRWSDEATSQVFATREDAMIAAKAYATEDSGCGIVAVQIVPVNG